MSQAQPQYVTKHDPHEVALTGWRIHELALQRWFYTNFFLEKGEYPIPVIFKTPRLAFAEFDKLFQSATNPENPFHYLTKSKVYPSQVKYPLITVRRTGSQYRASQSYSIHRFRRVAWPTVADNVARKDLATASQAQMPSAWDFTWQVSFFCRMPQTQAYFDSRLHSALKVSAGAAQTFIVARYPHHHGPQYLRLYLTGGIDSIIPDELNEQTVEYQSSFNLVMEGYNAFYDLQYYPSFWALALGNDPLSQGSLNTVFDFNEVAVTEDLRDAAINPVLDSAIIIPSAGTHPAETA